MRTPLLAALVAALGLAAPALGDPPRTPAHENPQAAHAETDKNKDGQIDRTEFNVRIVDVFYAADGDKNGGLSEAEFATIDTVATFGQMDKNHDGSVSLAEFIDFRFEQFDEADKDNNGTLSLEEVEEYVK
jgi:EF hand